MIFKVNYLRSLSDFLVATPTPRDDGNIRPILKCQVEADVMQPLKAKMK